MRLVNKGKVFFWTAICLMLGSFLIQSMEIALLIPTNHLDGAFQTASGLFRISEGQWPGRDFYSYLGTGLLALLYPVFAAFGENLSATVISAHFVVYLAFFVSTYIVFRLSRPELDKRWSLLVSIGIIVFLSFSTVDLYILRDRLSPGNSLRPVRAFLPYIAFFTLYFVLKSEVSVNKKVIASAVIAALCFLWSNDFAIPTAFLVLVVTFVWLIAKLEVDLTRLCLLVASFLFATLFVLSVSTRGHAFDLIIYNFVDVRKDQYWYFAPWFSYSRIFEVADIKSKILPDYGWQIYLMPATLLVACLSRRIEYFCFSLIGLAAFLGGAVATIGGHRGGYQEAYLYWSCIACGAIAWGGLHFILDIANRKMGLYASLKPLKKPAAVSLNIALIAGALTLLLSNYQGYVSREKQVNSNSHLYYERELGGYLDLSWKQYIEKAKSASNELSVLEEYWGIWGAVTRSFAPKTDSVIHALGGVKNLFFKDPEVVITTRASVSYWQQWSFAANYWFYSRLIKEYRVTGFSPTTLIWQKNEVKQEFEYSECSVKRDDSLVVLDVEEEGYYELELVIDISLVPSRSLLLVKNNINYAWGAAGYLSLDTSRVRHTIPVSLSAGRHELPVRLIDDDHENKPPMNMVLGCRIARIPALLYDVTKSLGGQRQPYPLSDRNWTAGIANFAPVLLVSNTSANKEDFQIDSVIQFGDGQERQIVQAVVAGEYINVQFSGEKLDPDIYGYPNSFSVFKLKQKPYPLSDRNWRKGIAIFGSVLLLSNTSANKASLKAGAVIRFADGQEREVVKTTVVGDYLNIYFSGEKLDPNIYGYPNQFSVIPSGKVITQTY